jgi:hypothetical protein
MVAEMDRVFPYPAMAKSRRLLDVVFSRAQLNDAMYRIVQACSLECSSFETPKHASKGAEYEHVRAESRMIPRHHCRLHVQVFQKKSTPKNTLEQFDT